MDNPTIPCEICNRDILFNDYIEHVELCRNRSYVLNLLNPMLNTFLTNNNIINDIDTTNFISIDNLVDEYQMNNIISEVIGVVHNGVNDIDLAMVELDDVDIDKSNNCSICLESFDEILFKQTSNDKVSIIKTKCNHTFCKTCITKWFQENNTCPLCLFDFNK